MKLLYRNGIFKDKWYFKDTIKISSFILPKYMCYGINTYQLFSILYYNEI